MNTGIRIINTKADFSKLATTGMKRDITSQVTNLTGVINPQGNTLNSTFFLTKQLDVSGYQGKTIDFTFIKYTSSGGAGGSYGCGFCDESGSFTLIKSNEPEESGATKVGSLDVLTNVTIPDTAVVLKTVWFTESAISSGVYSGSNEDFYVYLID